jgi:hypothetical protein
MPGGALVTPPLPVPPLDTVRAAREAGRAALDRPERGDVAARRTRVHDDGRVRVDGDDNFVAREIDHDTDRIVEAGYRHLDGAEGGRRPIYGARVDVDLVRKCRESA